MGQSKSKVSAGDLAFLQSATGKDSGSIQTWYDNFLAECPNGNMSRAKMAYMYQQIFPNGNAVNFSENMFNAFDTDNSGTVNFREFIVVIHITTNGTPEEMINFMFKIYDLNRDGTISYMEVLKLTDALFELQGEEKVVGKAGETFDKLDKNDDGMVTLGEFLSHCRNDEKVQGALKNLGSVLTKKLW